MKQLFASYQTIRAYTCSLCSPLQVEDYSLQGEGFTSPAKWHLAHTTWFFEEMILKNHFPHYEEFDSVYCYLFNSYYNTIGKRIKRHQRGLISRPSVDEIYEYRNYVDKFMKLLLEDKVTKDIEELIILGLNHEQQHQELLLTDIKYNLALNPIHPTYDTKSILVNTSNVKTGWVTIQEGVYEVGHAGEGFCFDNERKRHKVYLNSFEVSNSLITNGEYLAFVEDGGYHQFHHWLDEGWAYIQAEKIEHPLYWFQEEGKWFQYTLGGDIEIDPDAILSHVSYYEAVAFANWKGQRLLTEFEWEIASQQFQWGDRWEWTSSAYLPYPQYEAAKGAVGEYNGKFMVNQMVLRGASVATSPHHSRPTYRNFFHPKYQWQFTGIRLAK